MIPSTWIPPSARVAPTSTGTARCRVRNSAKLLASRSIHAEASAPIRSFARFRERFDGRIMNAHPFSYGSFPEDAGSALIRSFTAQTTPSTGETKSIRFPDCRAENAGSPWRTVAPSPGSSNRSTRPRIPRANPSSPTCTAPEGSSFAQVWPLWTNRPPGSSCAAREGNPAAG